jgi:hypothetical protein
MSDFPFVGNQPVYAAGSSSPPPAIPKNIQKGMIKNLDLRGISWGDIVVGDLQGDEGVTVKTVMLIHGLNANYFSLEQIRFLCAHLKVQGYRSRSKEDALQILAEARAEIGEVVEQKGGQPERREAEGRVEGTGQTLYYSPAAVARGEGTGETVSYTPAAVAREGTVYYNPTAVAFATANAKKDLLLECKKMLEIRFGMLQMLGTNYKEKGLNEQWLKILMRQEKLLKEHKQVQKLLTRLYDFPDVSDSSDDEGDKSSEVIE